MNLGAVEKLAKFEIQFSGLKTGKHLFEFDVDQSFFKHFDHSLIENGQLKANVTLDKQVNHLLLDFKITGFIELECDRCAGLYNQPVEINQLLMVKFGSALEEESDEILVIPVAADRINVAQYLYEYISLAKPMHCEHPIDKNGKSACDPKMLKILNKFESEQKPKETDHRWDELLKIKKEGLS